MIIMGFLGPDASWWVAWNAQDEDGEAIEAMWDPTKPQSLHVSSALAAAGVGASDMAAAQDEERSELGRFSTSPPDSWETLEAGEGLYEGALALPTGPASASGDTRPDP